MCSWLCSTSWSRFAQFAKSCLASECLYVMMKLKERAVLVSCQCRLNPPNLIVWLRRRLVSAAP